MNLKFMIFIAVVIGAVLVVVLNPHLVADQVLTWAQQNQSDPNVPEIIYDTGRACEFLTDGDTAIRMFNYLYQTYPDNAALCAPALYYCGRIKADASYLKGLRVQAIPYLQTVIDQYPKQDDWASKAQSLIDEVQK